MCGAGFGVSIAVADFHLFNEREVDERGDVRTALLEGVGGPGRQGVCAAMDV